VSNVGHITERLAERISAVETALAGPAVAGAGSAAASCQYFAILYGACRISGVSGKNLRKGCHVTWASSYRTGGAAKKPRKMSEIDDCARYFDHFSFVAKQLGSSTYGFVNRKSVECAQVVHNRQSRSFSARKWRRHALRRPFVTRSEFVKLYVPMTHAWPAPARRPSQPAPARRRPQSHSLCRTSNVSTRGGRRATRPPAVAMLASR